jgi:hypothetical protein
MSDGPESEAPNPGEFGSVPPEQPGGAGGGGRPWGGVPPGSEAPARAPDATRRGVLAALAIFGVVVVVHLLLLAAVKLSGDSNNAWLFLPEGIVVIVGGLVAAALVARRLPPGSNLPFWATAVVCMFLSFIVWGATCAVAL